MNEILLSRMHVQYHLLSVYYRSQVIHGQKNQYLHPVEHVMRCNKSILAENLTHSL